MHIPSTSYSDTVTCGGSKNRYGVLGEHFYIKLMVGENLQVLWIYSPVLTKSAIYSFMLMKLDKVFIFAMSLVKTKSLMNRKIKNCEDQNIKLLGGNV